MNRNKYIILLAGIALGFASCNSGYTRRNPGKTFVPDMTYSRAYDAYTYNPNTADSLTSQQPVAGTVARGQFVEERLTIADSAAYKNIANPYTFTDVELDNGRRLYNIHCGVCHGDKLDGNGPLYNGGNGKYAAMPANLMSENIKALSDGTYYYTIMYGKNKMGSYANHLNHKERWEVISYIRSKNSK